MKQETLLIVVVFLGYFALHSLTASLWLKQLIARCCPAATPYYRLGFNLLASLTALPLIYLAWRFPGEPLWHWQGVAFYLVNIVALLAVIALVYSIRLYDMSEFMGLRQVRGQISDVNDQENFRISPFHRYVRHPWYFLILVIIWTRDLSTNQLLIYCLVTLYLIIGSRLEERKLIAYHGEVYREYSKRVAGLFPLPWKLLSENEAKRLLRKHGKNGTDH